MPCCNDSNWCVTESFAKGRLLVNKTKNGNIARDYITMVMARIQELREDPHLSAGPFSTFMGEPQISYTQEQRGDEMKGYLYLRNLQDGLRTADIVQTRLNRERNWSAE